MSARGYPTPTLFTLFNDLEEKSGAAEGHQPIVLLCFYLSSYSVIHL